MPIVDGFKAEFDHIHFERVNVGSKENERFQQTFGLRGHPSWVALDATGAIVEKRVGAISAENLRAILESLNR